MFVRPIIKKKKHTENAPLKRISPLKERFFQHVQWCNLGQVLSSCLASCVSSAFHIDRFCQHMHSSITYSSDLHLNGIHALKGSQPSL